MLHKTVTENKISVITARLIGLILKMPLEERLKLLTEIEMHLDDPKTPIRRKHTRKTHLTPVDYTVKNRLFKGFVINLSAGGVFIESSKGLLPALSRRDQVILSFGHPEKKDHLKVTGEVARIDKKGIGIKFDQTIMELWAN